MINILCRVSNNTPLCKMSSHKRLSCALIVGLTISMPLLYVIAFGPACWCASHANEGYEDVSMFYQPVLKIWFEGPPIISRSTEWYANLLAPSKISVGCRNRKYLLVPADLFIDRM